MKDGVEVKSKVDRKVVDGKEQTVGEYIATCTAPISLAQAEQLLRSEKGSQEYVEFTTQSKIIERKGANDWTVHMYFDAPYPLGDSDCVLDYQYVKTNNGFVVKSKSNPSGYELGSVDRMQHSEGIFEFEKIGESQTKITMSSSFAPAGDPPKWMLAAWFPKGPAKMMNRFIQAADTF